MTPSGKPPQVIQVGKVPMTKMTQELKYQSNNKTTRITAGKEDAIDTTATVTTTITSKTKISKLIADGIPNHRQ